MKTSRSSAVRSSSARGSVACRLLAAAAVSAGVFATASSASAAGLNDPGCKPTAARPYPAVVVHGQAGNFEGMRAVTDTLVTAGYCVYAKNYGYVPGGANGQDHLSTSAGQIGAQIDQVLAQTGATKVDVIGHSAGTGVLDNYILKKGGAAKVHRLVSFGGLHHPYAHGGLPKTLDASIFLPNLIAVARKVVPGISAQTVVKTALGLYAAAGAPLGPVDPALVATMQSNFTSDLFDPDYWNDLHGSLSEAPGSFVNIGQSERSRLTKDAAPNVCYTNIVAVADLLTGAAAGFQDEAPNVDNFVLVTSITQNAHNDMLADPVALGKMVLGLDPAPCTPAPVKTTIAGAYDGATDQAPSAEDVEAAGAFEDALLGRQGQRRSIDANAGCSVTAGAPLPASASAGGLLALGLAFAAWARRRAPASKQERGRPRVT